MIKWTNFDEKKIKNAQIRRLGKLTRKINVNEGNA
jgi:hypothetical protein